MEENKILEGRVEEQHGQLEVEELRRQVAEDGVMWLLHKVLSKWWTRWSMALSSRLELGA